jgi:hypothetical protein
VGEDVNNALSVVITFMFDLQLVDPTPFLKTKAPDPMPAVDESVFRSSMDSALTNRCGEVFAVLKHVTLIDLFAIFSLAHRLRLSAINRQRSQITSAVLPHT